MVDWLRAVVSKGRKRYVDGGFNLDLSYITPRIIAMSIPASGVEAGFRNDVDDVARFLEERHASDGHARYMVYNISGRRYDYDKFRNQVIDFPFPDHFPPTLPQLFKICRTMHSWLQLDPFHVVVVHCLAGKGRTGTVIAAYLLYSGQCSTVEHALETFAVARSESGEGVTNPCQRRYVEYFFRALPAWMAAGEPLNPEPMVLRKLMIYPIPRLGVLPSSRSPAASAAASPIKGTAGPAAGGAPPDAVPVGCTPFIQLLRAPHDTKSVHTDASLLFSSAWTDSDLRSYDANGDDAVITFQIERIVAGDILVRCYNLQTSSIFSAHELMFRLSLNVQFEVASTSEAAVVRFPKAELDAMPTVDPRYSEHFAVDLCFAPVPLVEAPQPGDAESLLGRRSETEFLSAPPHAGPDEGAGETKEGFLWKRGEIHTAFKRRWCCLRRASDVASHPSQSFSYFKNAADPYPRGSILISSVLRVDYVGWREGRNHCFTVTTASRQYVFCPDEDGEGQDEACARDVALEWVRVLVRARARHLILQADESFASARTSEEYVYR